MNHAHPNPSPRRRFSIITATAATLAAGGIIAVASLTSAAPAGPPHPAPLDTRCLIGCPEPDYTGPIIVPPPDDTEPPIIIVPPPDDTEPPVIVPPPDDTEPPIIVPPPTTWQTIFCYPTSTTSTPSTTIFDPECDMTPGGPNPPPANPVPGPPTTTPADGGGGVPFVEITDTTIDCAGIIHVTYETGATPEPAAETEHVVMFSPLSNPTAVTSQRLLAQPVNGVFTLDLQSPTPEPSRIYVIADFEPANLDGIIRVDESDTPAPATCPPTTTAN